jgi:hypothetical protein
MKLWAFAVFLACIIPAVLLTSCRLFKKQEAVDPDIAELRRQMEKLQAQVGKMEVQLDDFRTRLDAYDARFSSSDTPSLISGHSVLLKARCKEIKGKYFVTKKEAAELKENQVGIMTSMRVLPHVTAEGGMAGMKLYAIRSDSFPGSCGLRNGDIVTEVNGIKLTSPDKMLRVYEQIGKDGKAVIEIDRKGTPVEIVIETE